MRGQVAIQLRECPTITSSMTSFFVEFRLHGYAKTHARQLIWDVARTYGVRGMIRMRPVPHIGLYPQSSTHDIRDVIRAVQKVGCKYTLVPFSIRGFGCYRDSKVIYMDIEPSSVLKQLRTELTQELNTLLGKANPEYDLHTTIAFKDLGHKFDSVWECIKAKEQPDISQYLLRIAVLGPRARLVCEYDLILKRVLNRRQALSRYWWRQTVEEMRRLQGEKAEETTTIIGKTKRFFRRITG